MHSREDAVHMDLSKALLPGGDIGQIRWYSKTLDLRTATYIVRGTYVLRYLATIEIELVKYCRKVAGNIQMLPAISPRCRRDVAGDICFVAGNVAGNTFLCRNRVFRRR